MHMATRPPSAQRLKSRVEHNMTQAEADNKLHLYLDQPCWMPCWQRWTMRDSRAERRPTGAGGCRQACRPAWSKPSDVANPQPR